MRHWVCLTWLFAGSAALAVVSLLPSAILVIYSSFFVMPVFERTLIWAYPVASNVL